MIKIFSLMFFIFIIIFIIIELKNAPMTNPENCIYDNFKCGGPCSENPKCLEDSK